MAKQTWTGSDRVKHVLLDKIPSNTDELYATKAEVEEARDGHVSLSAKQDAQDNAIAALVSSSGVKISGADQVTGNLADKLLAGTHINFSLGNAGANETLTVNTDLTFSTGLTETSGVVAIKFGNASGTVCQGNDSRLSNARTPLAHDNAQHTTNYLAATNYATSTVGGTVKARLNGTTAYFTINGVTA